MPGGMEVKLPVIALSVCHVGYIGQGTGRDYVGEAGVKLKRAYWSMLKFFSILLA